MECDQTLLRIGNNLYTLHTAITCVKERNDCRSIGSIGSDVKQPADDLWRCEESSVKLESEVTTAECEIKIEAEQNPFEVDYDDESLGSSDMPGTSSFVQSSYTDDALEIDHDSNKEIEVDANDSVCNSNDTGAPIASASTVYNTKCGICRKLFLNEIELNTHMKSVHIISKNSFECDICLKRVKTANGLHIHKRYVHDETRMWKYKCKACKASFTQESSLQSHKCGEIIKCEFCDKVK